MQLRTIGDRKVSAIGLGGMELSIHGRPDRASAIATVHAALEAGVTLFDTADAYCLGASDVGHNETLIAEAIRSWGGDTDAVLIATKGGHTRTRSGAWDVDGRPSYIKAACEASLRAMGVEVIGLYQYHRPDPTVPYAETIGAFKDLLDEGKVQLVGISNADIEQIELASSILPLASVQNEFSPRFLSSYDELQHCAERGIAFLPYSPLGGMGSGREFGRRDAAFTRIAAARGVSPQRVCLAWMLALSPVVIPIPGCSRPKTIIDSAAAADLDLTPDEISELSGNLR